MQHVLLWDMLSYGVRCILGHNILSMGMSSQGDILSYGAYYLIGLIVSWAMLSYGACYLRCMLSGGISSYGAYCPWSMRHVLLGHMLSKGIVSWGILS